VPLTERGGVADASEEVWLFSGSVDAEDSGFAPSLESSDESGTTV